MPGSVDGAEPPTGFCRLTCCDQGGGSAGAQGGRELLDGVEYGIAVGLLSLSQLPEPVGHDVAETQSDAEHEADVENDDETVVESSAGKGESRQADQGDEAA